MRRLRSVNRAPFKYGLSATHAHLSTTIVRRPTVSDIRVFLKIGCVCSIFPQSLNQQGNSYFFNFFEADIALAVVVTLFPQFVPKLSSKLFLGKIMVRSVLARISCQHDTKKTVDSIPRCRYKSDIDFANWQHHFAIISIISSSQ